MRSAMTRLAEPPDAEDGDSFGESRITNRLRAEDRRPRRVALVVDDSEDARTLCRSILEDQGFWVQTAANGSEALDLLFVMSTPTIIVLDLFMPEMDGHELLDVLRGYSRFTDVPVLVITASDEEPVAARHTGFLRKPILGEALAERVRALLGEALP